MFNGFVLLPKEWMEQIAKHGIRMDWNYKEGDKVWEFHSRPEIEFAYWSKDRLTAMQVLKKLEK